MTKIVLILTFLLLSCVSKTSEGPVRVYPENPHYMMYMGKPILLVTSDEHYGAVVNTEFDYVAFLNKLSSKGFNFTRIYPGSYIEVENAFLNGNVLGVRNGKQILPWAKTNVPGASPVQGGYKYDLDKWNEEYFERLRDFCKQASSRGIIVEICFFNGEYNPEWGKGGWPIYIVAPGSYEENYIFNIPPGNYTAQWIDPASGIVKKTGKFNHKGGNLTLKTPIYTIDIALKLKSSAR